MSQVKLNKENQELAKKIGVVRVSCRRQISQKRIREDLLRISERLGIKKGVKND